jgi:GR25 family glycosyltransferase involved in LPS biosynthesis
MLNKYFDKIFVINLESNNDRWKHVEKQFKKYNITVERFIAIDGRCKIDKKLCQAKLNTFEILYDVNIKSKYKLQLLMPVSSLTIATISILRAMVRNKWERILICEDDINIRRKFLERFKNGINDIKNIKWDLLYLGGGGEMGNNGVSYDKTKYNKYPSPWGENLGYVHDIDDLRIPCDNKCKTVSDNISTVYKAGGTWCYAVSLKGAKKILKHIDNAGEHIDQILIKLCYNKILNALAFDPPLVMHEDIRNGRNTDIPW